MISGSAWIKKGVRWVQVGCLATVPLIARSQEQPNIVLILVDDMGVMDSSYPFLTKEGRAFRYPLNNWYHTPNMERLAKRGVSFEHFYALSVSSPSRTSLLTGQNSTRHHTTNWIDPHRNNRDQYGPHDWNWQGVKKSDTTLPRLLQQAGYRTIHIGKGHFGPEGSEGANPLNLGFDINIGGSSIGQPGSYYGEEGYGNIGGNQNHPVPHLEHYHGTSTFLTEALTTEALREVGHALERKQPFFLYFSHYAVHAPFQADPRFIERYEGRGASREAEAYASLIEGVDHSLGRIIDYLEQQGVAGNTLIIFLGDNGGDAPLPNFRGHATAAPLRGRKGTEFEGGMRVPFIIAWGGASNRAISPLSIKEGLHQKSAASIIDLFPTIIEATQIEPPKGYSIDGASLAPLLQTEKGKEEERTILVHFPHNHRGSYFTVYIEEGWKLIYYYNPEKPEKPTWSLYHLREDPFEENDLSEVHPEKCKALIAQMEKRLKAEGAQLPTDFDGRSLSLPTRDK